MIIITRRALHALPFEEWRIRVTMFIIYDRMNSMAQFDERLN